MSHSRQVDSLVSRLRKTMHITMDSFQSVAITPGRRRPWTQIVKQNCVSDSQKRRFKFTKIQTLVDPLFSSDKSVY